MFNAQRPARRTKSRLLGAGALSIALLAASCGSSGGSTDEATTTTAAAATTAAATTIAPTIEATTTTAAAVTTTVKAEEKPVVGGELKMGLESGVSTLDPALNLAQPADRTIGLSIYDPLINFDKDGKFVPFLAETVKNSDDLKIWTMTLRKGIKFHDGTDFNADAVVAHFARMLDPATKSNWATIAGNFGLPKALDSHTVEWNMAEAQIGFLNEMANVMGYIPSPTATAKDSAGFGLAPVGTGPFKLTSFESGAQVVVEKNPEYWRKADNGDSLPYLDKITYLPIPDTSKRLTAVKNGEVDLIQTADTSTVVQAEKDGLQVARATGSSSTIVLLNHKAEPTSDKRVRQAMAYATDKAQLNDIIYNGARTPSYSAFDEASPFFNKDITPIKYDPAKAKALLAEYGKPVEVVLECIPSPESDQILQLMKQQWEAVGMKVSLKSQEQGAYVTRIFGRAGDYTTACFRSNHFVEPDQIRGGLESNNATNLIFLANPDLDAALNEGRSTTDFAKRKVAYDKAQVIMADVIPTITLMYDIFGNIATTKVAGIPTAQRNSLGAIQVAGIWKKP